FREGRKGREKEAKNVEGMKARLGMEGSEMEVLPGTRGDEVRAELAFADVDVGKGEKLKKGKKKRKPGPEERKEMLARTVGKNTRDRMDPFLDGGAARVTGAGRTVLGVKKEMLARTVGRNTRDRMDPFLDGGRTVDKGRVVLGVKRKRGVGVGDPGGGDDKRDGEIEDGRDAEAGEEGPTEVLLPPPPTATATAAASKGLVDYDSD
ncbi:hypothetical protein V495_03020, partial [Pseudogymnoascus sp. VKM F-4514 (FW-929)]